MKALRGLEKRGEVVGVRRGVYSKPVVKRPRRESPKVAAPPTSPYAVVDAVLEELFPGGICVGHLTQVIEWREATKALLKLVEVK